MNEKQKQYLVEVRCEVRKELVVEGCTKQEAWDDPWKYCIEETEIDMRDWDVLSVKFFKELTHGK